MGLGTEGGLKAVQRLTAGWECCWPGGSRELTSGLRSTSPGPRCGADRPARRRHQVGQERRGKFNLPLLSHKCASGKGNSAAARLAAGAAAAPGGRPRTPMHAPHLDEGHVAGLVARQLHHAVIRLLKAVVQVVQDDHLEVVLKQHQHGVAPCRRRCERQVQVWQNSSVAPRKMATPSIGLPWLLGPCSMVITHR